MDNVTASSVSCRCWDINHMKTFLASSAPINLFKCINSWLNCTSFVALLLRSSWVSCLFSHKGSDVSVKLRLHLPSHCYSKQSHALIYQKQVNWCRWGSHLVFISHRLLEAQPGSYIVQKLASFVNDVTNCSNEHRRLPLKSTYLQLFKMLNHKQKEGNRW